MPKGIPKNGINKGWFKKGVSTWNKGLPNTWSNPPPPMYGEINPEWKGDNASYVAKHKWIYRQKGKADHCEFCGSKQIGRMYHWANISGEYKRDLGDWKSLCVPCHSDFDRSRRVD